MEIRPDDKDPPNEEQMSFLTWTCCLILSGVPGVNSKENKSIQNKMAGKTCAYGYHPKWISPCQANSPSYTKQISLALLLSL